MPLKFWQTVFVRLYQHGHIIFGRDSETPKTQQKENDLKNLYCLHGQAVSHKNAQIKSHLVYTLPLSDQSRPVWIVPFSKTLSCRLSQKPSKALLEIHEWLDWVKKVKRAKFTKLAQISYLSETKLTERLAPMQALIRKYEWRSNNCLPIRQKKIV